MSQLLSRIEALAGAANVLRGDALQRRNNGFWDPSSPKAQALVLPHSSAQLSAIMALCHAARQPVIVHGGLTGLTGAHTTTEKDIAVSLERMNAITAFEGDGKTLTAEAGCTLQHVQDYAAQRDMLFALDIGARGSCTIGGNIATNAGGMEVIRYGMMREQVLGLEVVLADGTCLSSLNQMQKNNAGFDLKQLFIGSEGTLGIVTKAVLRLHPAPLSSDSTLLACRTFSHTIALLNSARAALGATLTRFELMDGGYFRTQTAPGKHAAPMNRDHDWYVLMETNGSDPEADRERLESWLGDILEDAICEDAVVASNIRQRQNLWLIREAFDAVISETPCFLYDVSLPIGAMEAYIAQLRQDMASLWPRCLFYSMGHMGDGNLHFFVSPRQADDPKIMKDKADRLIYPPLQALGGSVSAEHGIGIDKKPWLATSRTAVEIDLMKKLKTLLDPHNILNPGRVVDI